MKNKPYRKLTAYELEVYKKICDDEAVHRQMANSKLEYIVTIYIALFTSFVWLFSKFIENYSNFTCVAKIFNIILLTAIIICFVGLGYLFYKAFLSYEYTSIDPNKIAKIFKVFDESTEDYTERNLIHHITDNLKDSYREIAIQNYESACKSIGKIRYIFILIFITCILLGISFISLSIT